MGELVGISLLDLRDDACAKCGMEKHADGSKDCCKDVSITIKTGDPHTFSPTVHDFNSFEFILPAIQLVPSKVNITEAQKENLCRAHSPPLLKHPLFLQFGNFRI
jgi:hypothetical protein